MKKIVASVILVMMLMTGIAIGESLNAEDMIKLQVFTKVADTIGLQRGTEIVIGATTAMNGTFSTDFWPGSTTDLDARMLIHGYSTVAWTRTHGMALDSTVVSALNTTQGDNGDYVFTITLADTLKYNEGTPITAKDYVFSLLLSGSAAIEEIGGTPLGLSHIAGYDSYISGKVDTLLGVRLISDRTFSITIAAESMPYFYGLAAINVAPLPMFVIAPGCDIVDNGFGTYITASKDATLMPEDPRGFTPGEFGEDMLRETLLDPVSGYVYAPRVTCGPYSFESFNRQTRTATFVANPYYVGNYEGQKPHIERIVIKQVFNDTMMQEMVDHSIDILHKVSNNEVIEEGLLHVKEGLFQYMNYPRTGMAFLSFACEEGPTASGAVRQAIARCVDRSDLIEKTVGPNNGIPVYGYYGLGQWMTTATFPADEENEKDELIVQKVLPGFNKPFDLEEAKSLLEGDGWVLNENGQPFVEGVDSMRYRDEDGELVPLLIEWAKIAESDVADILEEMLTENFKQVGIGLKVTTLPFFDMLEYYHRERERTYNMFYLASNFEYIFDPFYTFNVADEYQGYANTTGIRDESLMMAAKAMRDTNVNERREYVERWFSFQSRFVEVMPMVPLYSNVYYDFFPKTLTNFDIMEYASWADAIQYASFEKVLDLENLDSENLEEEQTSH